MTGTPSIGGIDIFREGLGHLLADRKLRVPFYQRAYAWKKPHVKDLYDDLRRAIDEGKTSYFLGSIVACPTDDDFLEIVDGQQRLASTAILLAAIRDHLVRLQDTEAADMLEREYLLRKKGFRKRSTTPSLTLSEVDNDFFLKRILSPPKSVDRQVKGPRESHRRIADAARIAAEHVRAIVGDRKPSDQMTIIDTWVEFLRDKAQVIFIQVMDHSDAFIIFETLNDRGLELSIADLTKNYLFGRAAKRVEEAKHNWARMVGILAAGTDQDITKVYIHQLWSSLNGITRDREVFARIRNKVYTEQSAVDFSHELAENALLYAALRSADHEFWQPFGSHARQHIGILASQLRVSQIRMLLLAVLNKFKQAEVKKVLPYCVHWSVRFLIAGGSPGNLESYYATHAVKIRRGEIKNAAELVASMSAVVPTDEQFKAAFAAETVGPEYHARYYLHCLERVRTQQANPHLATDDETVATLEHVLPRSPAPSVWTVDEASHERLINRLGNFALLGPRDNSNRGNEPFKTAKKVYAKSPFVLTQDLAEIGDDWNEEAINKRQSFLAELAVKAWPAS